MIEFEFLDTPGHPESRAVVMLSTSQIASFEPVTGEADRCLVVTTGGRQMVAGLAYAALRRLVIHARSGFATTLAESIQDNDRITP